MKRESKYNWRRREKMMVRIFTKVILKQSRSYESKRVILVGFIGIPPLKGIQYQVVVRHASYWKSAERISEFRW